MKRFLTYMFGWFVLVVILAELTLRVFGLAAKTMPTENIDGNYLFKPGATDYWVRGGLGEITNFYEINQQGYNSIIDYDKVSKEKINIALIGDSYIQGFQTDVRESIGRQLEEILGKNIVVHEYGKGGSTIVDFALTYEQYVKGRKYDYVFVLATDKDVVLKKASNIGRGNRVPKKTLSRQIYDNFHLLRYLNINHGLGVSFNTLINDGPESIARIHKNSESEAKTSESGYIKKLNQEALNMLPDSVIFLYEEDKISPYFIKNYNFEFLKIEHIRQPKDHGFDGHWNKNGRYNCAFTMALHIREVSKY